MSIDDCSMIELIDSRTYSVIPLGPLLHEHYYSVPGARKKSERLCKWMGTVDLNQPPQLNNTK